MKKMVVSLKNVIVDFPIYSLHSRSIKKYVISTLTGGKILSDNKGSKIVRALDNVSFDFMKGERIGLLGPNGSGKTTLLRVLTGIYEPISGSILINGTVNSMLSLNLGIDTEATGYENLVNRGKLAGLSNKRLNHMLDDVINFSELGEYINFPMKMYSSGMYMRLLFGFATSIPSDILLLDEWLSVGDKEFISKAERRMKAYVKNVETIVLASHDHALLKNFCTRWFELKQGKCYEKYDL